MDSKKFEVFIVLRKPLIMLGGLVLCEYENYFMDIRESINVMV